MASVIEPVVSTCAPSATGVLLKSAAASTPSAIGVLLKSAAASTPSATGVLLKSAAASTPLSTVLTTSVAPTKSFPIASLKPWKDPLCRPSPTLLKACENLAPGLAAASPTFCKKVPSPLPNPAVTPPMAPATSADFKASLILPPPISVPIPEPSAAPYIGPSAGNK